MEGFRKEIKNGEGARGEGGGGGRDWHLPASYIDTDH